MVSSMMPFTSALSDVHLLGGLRYRDGMGVLTVHVHVLQLGHSCYIPDEKSLGGSE
jgi:hypothetical protein